MSKKTWKILGLILAVVLVIGGTTYAATRVVAGVGAFLQNWQEEQQNTAEPVPESSAAPSKEETEAASVLPTSETVSTTGSLTDVSDIVASALPSVVSIEITKTVTTSSGYPWSGYYSYETTGAGSGIIIGDNGTEMWIVTNAHVAGDANTIKITFVDDTTADAYLKGSDDENDVAVVGVHMEDLSEETRKVVKAITIGSSDQLRLGEGVVVIGNAMGWGQSVTTGVISALKRQVTFENGVTMTLLQTSAAINGGNSGGAMLNSRGELVGINNSKYSATDVEGICFAIPIDSVLDIMQKLSLMEPRVPVSEKDYPYMGVTFKELTATQMQAYGIPVGAYVTTVGENTPAEKAGLLPYDVITGLDDATISCYEDLTEELQYHSGGTEVTLTVQRLANGRYEEITLPMTLGYKKNYTN